MGSRGADRRAETQALHHRPWQSNKEGKEAKPKICQYSSISSTLVVAVLWIHDPKHWRRFTPLTRAECIWHCQQHMAGRESPQVFGAWHIGLVHPIQLENKALNQRPSNLHTLCIDINKLRR